MNSDLPSKPARLSALVLSRLVTLLDEMLADPDQAQQQIQDASTNLDPQPIALWEEVFRAAPSYRDGILIQLAYGLESDRPFDHTQMGDGGRGVSGGLGTFNAKRHIPSVKDAYQNIGKNSRNLARGNVQAFDELLHWMNQSPSEVRHAFFRFAVATVALLARPVSPMPALARSELTFSKVAAFLDALFDEGSGGAYEQFAVAAFLEAVVEDFGLAGTGGLWVKTKNINASDASSGAAADVQIMRANRIEEGFEVSANDWRQKVDQALLTARSADLARIHLIAPAPDISGLGAMVGARATDLSVIDLASFLRTLTGLLRKPGREVALTRFYQLLDRNQPDVARVNRFVELLRSHSLAA